MASNAETLALARALLELGSAMRATIRAVHELTGPENQAALALLADANKADARFLENIQKLLDLMDKGHE
jgi:uncharacterized membrane protein YccC